MDVSLRSLLAKTVELNASDLHICSGELPSMRIRGQIQRLNHEQLSAAQVFRFADELMTETQRSELSEKLSVDFSFELQGRARFRANIYRQANGLSLALRRIPAKVMTLRDIKAPPILTKISNYRRGLVLVTGPTGSGKSTTLAAMIDYINQNFAKHIITIEDPIEYEFQDNLCFIEQREVGLDTESFQSALKHVLRQDPDIIMVGEMRDKFSFEAALQAADTGHLVMTTLHSSNASQTINRILDFYDKSEQDSIREALAINLRAIISQRLIPKAFGEGRVPGNEIMVNTPIITKLLMENRLDKLHNAIAAGAQDGMMTFNQRLLDLVNAGQITEEDAMEYSDNVEQLKMNFQGIFLGSDKGIVG